MSNEMILPVGTSPVHVLRMALSLPSKRFDNVILLVTDKTSEYGSRIHKVLLSENYQSEVIHCDSLEAFLKQKVGTSNFSIIMGPGRKQDALHLWKSVISGAKKIPQIWVHHNVITKKGNSRDGEYLKLLANDLHGTNSEAFKLPEISAETACIIYDFDRSILESEEELQWDIRKCKFVFTVSPPSGSQTIQTKNEYRNWEKIVLNKAKMVRETFGIHAVEMWHTPLPSKGWWLTGRERLADAGFRGANK